MGRRAATSALPQWCQCKVDEGEEMRREGEEAAPGVGVGVAVTPSRIEARRRLMRRLMLTRLSWLGTALSTNMCLRRWSAL